MASRHEVFAAIDSERDYQDMRKRRDGGSEFHSTEEFLLYMQDYLTETIHTASRTWGPGALPPILEGIRKVTALGVSAMEQHGAPQRVGHEREVGKVVDELTVTVDVRNAVRDILSDPDILRNIATQVNLDNEAKIAKYELALDQIADYTRPENATDKTVVHALAEEALGRVVPVEEPILPAPRTNIESELDDEIPF